MARRPKKEGGGGAPEWMATYSDLVTLLLCFFVMLFASSNVDSGKIQAISQSFGANNRLPTLENTSGVGINNLLGSGITQMPIMSMSSEEVKETFEKGQKELQQMASEFKTYFAEKNMADDIEITVEGTYIVLNFPDGILFDKGKADLKEGSLAALEIIADELAANPGTEIMIEGHTDSDPISTVRFPSNIDLACARAASVMKYFLDEKDIDPKRIGAVGYGEYRPVAENDTEENKGKNRRVEIKVTSSVYSQMLN